MNEEITIREHEVLEFLGHGRTIKEISELLFIADTTVITHREKLKEKLECKNTPELIYKASKLGLI